MMIGKSPSKSKALDQQPDHPGAVSEQQRTYGSDEDNLAIGETARYSDYEITLVSVEPYERGDRAYFEIEGKRKTTIKRYWFEGTAATRKTLSIDEASETLDQSLPEKIPLADGQSFNGYVYFEGGGLSSIRFSGGVLSSDRTWNFDQDASTAEQQEADEYFAALEKFGLTPDESENVRALFNELGIAGCQIDQTEAMFGSGIDELQSFRTWIGINPEKGKLNHGVFEHQINFTFEERRIFYVEITGFIVGTDQNKSYTLFNSDEGGYLARYIPESDSVEPW